MSDTDEISHPRRSAVSRWLRRFLHWCQQHPLPGVAALGVGVILALFGVAQGVEWALHKLNPPVPNILSADQERGVGGHYSVIVENPTDTAMVVSAAVFRAEPPPDEVYAHFSELRIPAVTYEVPFDCSPGTRTLKLRPPFKVSGKEVGAVVFRSTMPMKECQLYISMKTSQGDTKEQLAVSLAAWRERDDVGQPRRQR